MSRRGEDRQTAGDWGAVRMTTEHATEERHERGLRRLTRVRQALRAVSFVMLLKGMVGGSIATLALFGVVVPYLGIDPTPAHEGAAAGLGAVLGAILAFKS